MNWHKSSYSEGATNCVEVAETTGAALVRDTQRREDGHLTFPRDEWSAFLRDVKFSGR